MNSIETKVGWAERDLIEEEDEVIESLNELNSREFISNEMNGLPKDDDCFSLRNEANQIYQIDEERSDREEAQEIKSNQIQVCDSDNMPAPQIAKDYWRLLPDAKMIDVLYAVRADESNHRFVNHTLSPLL
ncbi:hypothetical protein DFH28DRAFT_1120584 [Melampsora americana]|nr:hypothetical protein DFH28DRAFT_1120584 [Melampsora americana]